jgi:hypothetical protein
MLLFITRILVFIAALSGLGVLWFGIVLPLFDQISGWLKTGEMPTRDLIWAQSPRACEATNGVDIGFAGKDFCRRADYSVDGWVGVTQILNYLGHQHIIVYSIMYLCAVFAAVFLYQDR